MKIRDAFNILEISDDASPEEIKKAYRAKAKLYHPDVNNSNSAQAEFECIQNAYTLIQAYIQYRESKHSHSEIQNTKIKRKQNSKQTKAAKKQWFEARIQYDISIFKKSKQYILSYCFAFIGSIVALGICIDYFSAPQENYEPIQHIEIPQNFHDIKNYAWKELYIIVQDRRISITPLLLNQIQNTSYLKIYNTPYLQQIKRIEATNSQPYTEIEFYNFYNDAFLIIVILLCGGISMFVFNKKSLGYYSIIRFYNLYCLPLIILFVLLGEARILRLFGIV
ncbi:MAG TPA: J domain-containing protein [Bacteroidales bacterium]|jgi:curved DNA-binding protein CbpA|nr:J domain-containing protein [Bacteroidales bacterium]HRS18203.1 J domain-containing protein [Bacteroidales bacterium]